jgi:predicted transcriptional regulator
VETYIEYVLDALGDPTRRSVFERLRGGARSVGEIAEGMDVSRPAVSQHLKVLKEARLVVDRAEGTRRLYVVEAQASKRCAVGSTDSGMQRSLRSRKQQNGRPKSTKGNHEEQSDGF